MLDSPIKIIVFVLLFFLCWSCDKTDEITPPEIPTNSTGSIRVIQDEVEGQPIVLAGSVAFNFIVSYSRILEGDTLSFTPTSTLEGLPIVMKDQAGGNWDIFGRAISGPHTGKQLETFFSTMGYWFVFSAFYESVAIYNELPAEVHSLPSSQNDNWLIPFNLVFDGGPGFDGIPALTDPAFSTYSVPRNIDDNIYLEDKDLVIGIKQKDQLKLYPHPILDWHEIVNDEIEDEAFALIYCPLTGTTTVWDRWIGGNKEEFGVSGFLYNSNVIPFDRASQSFWSQLYNKSINGAKLGSSTNNYAHVETTWSTWKIIAPTVQYLSEQTGYSRDYNRYPYGSYKTNNSLLFPITYEDDRLPPKERVHAVIVNDKVKVYRFEHFD